MFRQEFFKLNWSNLDNPKNHFTQIPNSNSSVNILKNEIYLKGQKNINAFSKLLFDDDASENDMLIVDGDDFEYSIYINSNTIIVVIDNANLYIRCDKYTVFINFFCLY